MAARRNGRSEYLFHPVTWAVLPSSPRPSLSPFATVSNPTSIWASINWLFYSLYKRFSFSICRHNYPATLIPPHVSLTVSHHTLSPLRNLNTCFQWESRFKTANLQTFTMQFFQNLVADGVGSWLELLLYYSKFLKLCSTVYLGFQK